MRRRSFWQTISDVVCILRGEVMLKHELINHLSSSFLSGNFNIKISVEGKESDINHIALLNNEIILYGHKENKEKDNRNEKI